MSQSGKRNPPYRAEHIGSLLRPPELIRAREAAEGGAEDFRPYNTADFPELRQIEDRFIREAIALQEELGLQSITDGEFRRRSFWQDFALKLAGVGSLEFTRFGAEFHDEGGQTRKVPTAVVEGRIRRTQGIETGNFAFVKATTRRTPKVTLPAPPILHFFGGRSAISQTAYPDLALFWDDLAKVYQEEIADLARLGCTYLQLDEVILAFLCDSKMRDLVRARGDDPDSLVDTYISAINAALAKRPADLTVGIHLCRGNSRAHWLAEGSYEYVAEKLFNEISADTFFLEFDTPRAGDFAPLRHIPKGKTIVLGLVSTKTPVLESPDFLKQRIDAASKYVDLSHLALSPQCGFASHYLGTPLTVEDQKAKLRLVVEVANAVWH